MAINKLLPNLPITKKDITNAKSICGPYLAGMRGKTVRHKPIRLDMEEYVIISTDFYRLHTFVTLNEDAMFVNGTACLIA